MPGQELMEERLEAAIQVGPCDIILLGCAAQCENSFVKFGKLYFCVLSLVFKRRPFNILWPFRHVSKLRFVFFPVNKNLLQDLRCAISVFQLPMGFTYTP